MIHACKVIHNIRNNSIADMVKTKYGREIKPVEKFQDISYVKGSGFDGCDQFDRGFDGDGSHGDGSHGDGSHGDGSHGDAGNRLIANLKGFVVADDDVDDVDDDDDVDEWSDYSSSDEEWGSDNEKYDWE